MASGGRISTGTRSSRGIRVDIRIEGVERTSQEFKEARRSFSSAIRDVMDRVGTREVLPDLKSEMARTLGERWAGTMGIQRERSGVFVKSSARGPLNRALGWLDFGGKRPLDSARRTGPYVIVKTLDRKRDRIDDAVLAELLKTFRPLETDKTGL